MKNYILLMMLPLLALVGCDTTKKATTEKMNIMSANQANPTPVKVMYKKGPCMGKCPVFTMEIDEAGNAVLNGRKYARLQGEHTMKLEQSTLSELHRQIALANFMFLEDKYDSGILDVPTVTIAAESMQQSKNVTLRGMMPDVVKPIADLLDKIYNSDAWKPVAVPMTEGKSFLYIQGPCYGSCPVFTLDINEAGEATYVGKAYSKKQGTFKKVVSREEMAELSNLFEKADWFKLPTPKPSGITDISRITISHKMGDMIKKMDFHGNMPEEVQVVSEWMQAFANSKGWIKESSNDYGLPAGTIANEIIVKLKKESKIDDFVASYIKQNMQLKKTVVASMQMYLVTFDPNTMTPQEMIKDIKKRAEVIEAEFNKELSNR